MTMSFTGQLPQVATTRLRVGGQPCSVCKGVSAVRIQQNTFLDASLESLECCPFLSPRTHSQLDKHLCRREKLSGRARSVTRDATALGRHWQWKVRTLELFRKNMCLIRRTSWRRPSPHHLLFLLLFANLADWVCSVYSLLSSLILLHMHHT